MYNQIKKLKRYFIVLLLFSCFCFGRTACAKTKLWNYGDQLTGESRVIYQALQKVPDMEKYYVVTSKGNFVRGKGINIKLGRSYSGSQLDGLWDDFTRAEDAFLRDRSDLFWISGFWTQTSANSYPWKYDTITLYPKDYYNGIRSEIRDTQSALKRAVNYVKKQKTTYEKVKAAHDYVARLISYNTKDTKTEYNHTITGALLDKYNHKGVCESYAKLFDIICKANNIPSILVQWNKIKGNTIYSKNHMWNYVQMNNGKWYVVDVTFDDPVGYDEEINRYDYFLAGSRTQIWGETVGETHTGTGYSIASLSIYKPFKLPTLAKQRFTK